MEGKEEEQDNFVAATIERETIERTGQIKRMEKVDDLQGMLFYYGKVSICYCQVSASLRQINASLSYFFVSFVCYLL